MSGTRISNLPAATSVNAADIFPIVQSGTTKKATFGTILDGIVIPDGSVTEDKLADEAVTEDKVDSDLLAKLENAYVTPEMFGAVGDGTTDDTTALVNSLSYSSTNKIQLVCNNTYKVYNTKLTIMYDTIVNGKIEQYGSTVGVQVGSADVNTWHLNIKINVENKSKDTNFENTCGVECVNVLCSNIEVNIIGFYEGFKGTGINNKGFVYNKINVNEIRLFKYGIVLNSSNSGWSNENQFYCGRIWNNNSAVDYKNEYGIYIISGENNTFYTPCLEQLKYGVYIVTGRNNYFLRCRMEGTTTPFTFGNNQNNFIDIGYGNSFVKLNSFNSFEDTYSRNLSMFKKYEVYDSGNLAGHCAEYGQWTSAPKLVRRLITSTTGGDVKLANMKADPYGLKFNAANAFAGVTVHTKNSKYIVVEPKFYGSAQYKIGVMQFDGQGNHLDEATHLPVCNNLPTNRTTPTFTTTNISGVFGGTISNTSTFLTDSYYGELLFKVDDICEEAYVFIYSGSDPFVLQRLKIYSNSNLSVQIINNVAVLNGLPTSTGIIGQFVAYGTTSSTKFIGYVWTGDGVWRRLYGDNPSTT